MARIELDKIHLDFNVRSAGRIPLKQLLVHGLYRRSVNPRVHIHALDGVSFTVGEGERVGVIGHNGAGKSTLLRLVGGIYPPSRGRRVVDGRISSLFDISLGFEPTATGWENIRYGCYLRGETPKTLSTKLKRIAEFSELGSFLDLPIRHYSTGMALRLAFAIATSIEPEILLIDEVFAAGDVAFQTKAADRMLELVSQARILMLVSHSTDLVARLCQRVLWLDRGHLRMDGPAKSVIAAFKQHMLAPGPQKTGGQTGQAA